MITYFGGAEVPHYRELMHERGVLRMAMNYVSHSRRSKDTSWNINEHFPAGSRIFIESGARTYNRPGVNVPRSEIEQVAESYYSFIAANIDRIDGYLDFDATALDDLTRGFWRAQLHPEKCVVVWHAGDGIEELERLCERHPRVAVSDNSLDGESLIPLYRRLARTTKLHLLGVDRSLMLKGIAWHSCSFSSWISASSRGETFIWAGRELRRYDTHQKADARKRHAALITALGLDADKIARDDPDENLRLSLWSWGQHFAYLDRGDVEPVTPPALGRASETASPATAGVDDWALDTAHQEVTRTPPTAREKTVLPGLETTEHTVYVLDPEDGVKKPTKELRLAVRDPDIRVCDGCFLAAKCPEYDPGQSCAYSIPVRVSTKEQRSALFDAVIEMQAQRVFFMRVAEEGDGGYADKQLSAEIDRLRKLLQTKDDLENTGFSLVVKAQQRGDAQTGLLTRLFGRDGNQPAISQEPTVSAEQALAEMGVIDAEVIEDRVTE